MAVWLSPFEYLKRIWGGIYLESGFLDLVSTAKCVENTFKQAKLRFLNTEVSGYFAGSTTPLGGNGSIDLGNTEPDSPYVGEVLTDNMNSLTLVGTLSGSVTDLCLNTYTSGTDIYGDADTYVRRLAQKHVPASMYSGKLRLFVQAIYGSLRTDYEIALDGSNNPDSTLFKLIVNGYTLEHGVATAGLFTDSDYNYYIISANHNSFTFYPLTLSTAGSDWRDILKTHPNRTNREFSSRVEAYILSGAVVDTASPTTVSTGVTVAGSPMGFGFKFNWAGNQCKCIFHESLGTGVYESRTLTVDITDTLTLTASVSAATQWSNGEVFNFLYPDYTDNRVKIFGVVNGFYTNSTGTPMTGYYDYNDVWRQWEYVCNITTGTINEDSGVIDSSDIPGYGLDAVGYTRHTKVRASSGIKGTIGYKFLGSTYTYNVNPNITKNDHTDPEIVNAQPTTTPTNIFGGGINGGRLMRDGRYTGQMLREDYPRGFDIAGWYYNGPATPQHRVGYDAGSAPPYTPSTIPWVAFGDESGPVAASIRMNSWERRNGCYELAEIMCAVPMNDCECIITATFVGDTWTSRDLGTSFLSGVINLPLVRARDRSYTSTGTNSFVGSDYYLDCKQILTGSGTGHTITTTSTEGAGASLTTTISYQASGFGNWTHIVEDDAILKTETTTTAGFPSWAEQFFRVAPLVGSPYEPVLIARASANGASIVYHELNVNGYNKNGYPPGANMNSVGWS